VPVGASVVLERDSDDSPEDADEPEKIEVHVHVHRDPGASRRRSRPKPINLTGSLMDWQGHYEKVRKSLPETPSKTAGGSRLGKCHGCGAAVGYVARSCRTCGAPQQRGLVSKVFAAIGLGTVIGVFSICSHILGGSAQEHRSREPLGEWTTEEPYVIQVPVAVSPFNYDISANGALWANAGIDPSEQLATP
jgi:hypothetical protein